MSTASERLDHQNTTMILASMTTMTAEFSNKFFYYDVACMGAMSS